MTTAKHAPMRETAARSMPGDLRSRTWKRFLRGPDPVLLDELYVPALTEAVRYDRCCAYFSSSVLSAAARGFGKLIERLMAMEDRAPRLAVRLIVNEELDPADVQAMVETGDTSRLEIALKKRFKNPRDVLQKKRLAMLGWMIKSGLMEVRVGIMRQGTGIVHAKFGIMADTAGDAIVFSGSGNESAKGLIANYERIDVSTSWDDPDRHSEYAGEFDRLWRDEHADDPLGCLARESLGYVDVTLHRGGHPSDSAEGWLNLNRPSQSGCEAGKPKEQRMGDRQQ